jgi:hypothetical protein
MVDDSTCDDTFRADVRDICCSPIFYMADGPTRSLCIYSPLALNLSVIKHFTGSKDNQSVFFESVKKQI